MEILKLKILKEAKIDYIVLQKETTKLWEEKQIVRKIVQMQSWM